MFCLFFHHGGNDNVALNKNCLYINLHKYVFHYMCCFHISKLQSVIDFVFRACHINCNGTLVYEIFVRYSKFVKEAEVCQFFPIVINSSVPNCSYYIP